MVQTDLTQLSRECSSWMETLRNFRTELTTYRTELQAVVARPISRSDMPQVEHYDNQIEIQLRNINQLKHEIKDHERNVSWEQGKSAGNVSDGTGSQHEALLDRYEVLERTLVELKDEFGSFMKKLG